MTVIARAVAVGAWMVMCAAWLLGMAGAVPEIWSIMAANPAVANGPWWSMAERYRTLVTTLIPAILFLAPVLYWVIGNVREEADQEVLRP